MSDNYNIQHYPVLDSTSSWAREHFEELPHLTVISTDRQLKGYGRLGRNWHSPDSENIYLSIILKDYRPEYRNLAQLGALAAAEVLLTLEIKARIKWPNDVLVGGKKICGILAESTGVSGAVLGLGLNVNMDDKDLSQTGCKATSIFSETGKPASCEEIRDMLLKQFSGLYNLYRKLGFSTVRENLLKLLYIPTGEIQVENGDFTGPARILDMDEEGYLRLETDSGTYTLSSGNIIY